MSNLTSTLTLQLKDDGLQAKAKADADALKKLGATSADLKKLGGAGAKALKELDALAGKGARIDAFKAGSKALKEQGTALRQARATVTKEAAAFARAQATGDTKATRAAEKAHASAMKREAAVREAFIDRGRAVRASRNDLLGSGVGRAGRGLALGAAEKQLAGDVEAANAVLRDQIALLGRVAGAEHKAAAAAKTHAMAEAMGSADSRRQAIAAANRRLKAGMGNAGGMGAAALAGAEAGAAAHGRGRGGHGDRDAYIRHHGVVGTAAAAAAGYASAHGVLSGVERTLHAGAGYQHEVVALQNAGRTPEEMREIEEASRRTKRDLPTATYGENLKVINETTGAFGSLHHAIENLTFMSKAASVIHASAGDKVQDGAGELGNKLARFFEMRGTAGNTPVFQREAGEMVRAMTFTRGNFNPSEMINFGQQAKASLPNYSERFMTKIVPSLVTEFGGDRAGTAANAWRGVVMGKANDAKQAQEWMRLGLLDPKQTIVKAGHAVSWKAGAVKNTDLALSDPLRWMEEVQLPAMRAKGINVDEKLELTKALGTLYRNSNSNLFAEALSQALSRSRLHKDEDNINKSATVDQAYSRNLVSDPTESAKAFRASMESLSEAVSGPAMETAAAGIAKLAGGITSLSLAAKDHPIAAMAAGTAVAGGALAGAGALSYGLMNGFGLGASATALDASAAALTAAAAELGGAGVLGKIPGGPGKAAGALGKMGALGFIGSAGLGVAAIGAGVMAVDASLPNANRMNGNGRQFRRAGEIEGYPSGWGPGGGVNVGGGIGATGGSFTTNRPKSWGETVFGSTRAGGRDPTRMDLPVPPSMMPAPARVQQPGFASQTVPLPPARPVELGGAAPKVDASQVEGLGPKVDAAKQKVAELNGATARPTIDASSISSAEGAVDSLLRKIAQVGSAAAGATAAVNAIPSPSAGALHGRPDALAQAKSRTFSDYPTPGYGQE